MSAIDKLKKARNIEELATEIEPLALALASLSDDGKKAIASIKSASKAQAEAWSKAQEDAARSMQQQTVIAVGQIEDVVEDWQGAASKLSAAASAATKATGSWKLKLWVAVLASSLIPTAVLLLGLWLWLDPQLIIQEDQIWLRLK